MAKKTATTNTTIGPWPIPHRSATVFLKAVNWDGATAQLEFLAPWGGEYVADARYKYTADTVDLIAAGAATSVRVTFTGGGASMDISADIID